MISSAAFWALLNASISSFRAFVLFFLFEFFSLENNSKSRDSFEYERSVRRKYFFLAAIIVRTKEVGSRDHFTNWLVQEER